MNKDDKFIKEKLDIVSKLDEEVEVPDSLRAKCAELALAFAKEHEKEEPTTNKRRVFGGKYRESTSTAAAVSATKRNKLRWVAAISLFVIVAIAIIVPCALLLPNRGGNEFFYKEEDLQSYSMTYEEMVADYDLLYPTTPNIDDTYIVGKDKRTQVPVYATMDCAFNYGDLEVTVVFVNNYNVPLYITYNNDVTEPAETDLLAYTYKFFDGVALAKCEYNGYRYYFRYTSDDLKDFFDIMSSLRLM